MTMLFSRDIRSMCVTLVFVSGAPAGVINVPGDQPTIQAGIDAAADGDEVVVADGTYTGPGNVNLDFGGRAITVRSASGDPDLCIIDCQSTPGTRGFILQSGETAEAVVDGVTVTHGNMAGGYGGAIRLIESSPTITNCVFIDNSAFESGAAIAVNGGSPTITNSQFLINSTIDGNGGAISLILTDDVTVTGCFFLGNTALLAGGRGGGIYSNNSFGTVLVTGCQFVTNSAFQGGGISGDGYTVINCLFSGNSVLFRGGAMNLGEGLNTAAVVTNCTLRGNTAGFAGGGINIDLTDATVTNCIVWGNTPDQIDPDCAACADVTFSDVQGGYAGGGNIEADPLFVNGLDHRLRADSPCIDAGNNFDLPPGTTTDLAGNPRFIEDPLTPDTGPGDCSIVDLGALEFQEGVESCCLWDLDADDEVGIDDFLGLLGQWGTDPGGPPDFDGNGDVGIEDFLELLANWGSCPGLPDCNGNGQPDVLDVIEGTSPDCNGDGVPDECTIADGTSDDCNSNGIPDDCEIDCNGNGVTDACDIADGTSMDFDENGIPDECQVEPVNNGCAHPLVIAEGAHVFDTTEATTDGAVLLCDGGAGSSFVQDIWYLYTPVCTGVSTATFSVCNDATFDTRLAVYFDGGLCPPTGSGIACSDNAPGCGLTSEVQIQVFEGIVYRVRVGGVIGASGTGTLTVTCSP